MTDRPSHSQHTNTSRVVLLSIAAMLIIISIASFVVAGTGGTAADLPGWIEAFATLTAVVAVIVAWFQLSDSRAASREQAEQAAQAALDQARPYVLVSVDRSPISMHFIDLVIENVGAGPAYDVEIEVDPPFLRAEEVAGVEIAEARLFRKPISMLPPRYVLRSFYDDAAERHDKPDLPESHDVTIRYHDGRGHNWTEHLTLDLTIPNGLLFTEEYNLHHLAKAVREIEKHIKGSPLRKGEINATTESRAERSDRLKRQREEHQALLDSFRPSQPEEPQGDIETTPADVADRPESPTED